MTEIYFSTDCETDGPIPGVYSMRSFATAAYLPDKTLVGTFSANLIPLPRATTHLETMRWWDDFPEAWRECNRDQQKPETAMRSYDEWVKGITKEIGGKPVFVAYPAGFDFMFMYWYMIRFVGSSPFKFSALDMKSFAMPILKKGYLESTKDNMPKEWFDPLPHTHKALDDAIEQGALFCNMLKASGIKI